MVDFNYRLGDDSLIEDARMAASSEWEVEFVESILRRRSEFGDNFGLTEKQRKKLREIAEGPDDDLTTRRPRWGRR